MVGNWPNHGWKGAQEKQEEGGGGVIDLFDALAAQARERFARRRQPRWVDPALATLTHDRFSDPGWIFEPKFDGERCLAFRSGDEVRLLTRNRKQVNDTYPELVDALTAQQAGDFVVDGEVVAFDRGVSSFARLQRRIRLSDPEEARASGVAVYFYVFDVLHADGCDTTGLTLRERKSLLRRLLSFDDPLRYTTHHRAEGEHFWAQACRKGWEGIIAKRADAPYQHGRTSDWQKFKCENAQEFVIGGYTDPRGSRAAFGALLLGYHDAAGDLVYAGKVGKVGTGFDQRTLLRLGRELVRLERPRSAFARGGPPRSGGVHWVEPWLVGEVSFTEWTADGELRHPRFQGLRRDKRPSAVIRE
jgi:DNA ligase D-like protein (predicted ligase)